MSFAAKSPAKSSAKKITTKATAGTALKATRKPARTSVVESAVALGVATTPEAKLLRAIFGENSGEAPHRLDLYVDSFRKAPPITRIEAERDGVSGGLVKEMAKSMGMSNIRMFEVIGVPKATAEKRAANNTAVTGTSGQAALGVVRLLGIAKAIAENSTAPEAVGFDTAKWLGDWIERPQPALGGRKPADMLDTPTGVETVAKLLGAIESGVSL